MTRHRADALAAATSVDPGALALLGDKLAAHVRLEEREVFPLIERVMPEHELDAVARAVEAAHPAR